MMVELLMRKREMDDDHVHDMEDTSRYEKSGVFLDNLCFEDLVSVFSPAGLGVVPAISGMVNRPAHEILQVLFSQDDVPSPLISHFLVLNSMIT